MNTTPAGAPPWAGLPADIAGRLRPALPGVVEELIDMIAREVPSYSRPLEGRFGAGVRRGVQVALNRFLDLPGTTQPALQPAERHVYLQLGRGELRQGRSLEALLAAYRVGARVAFRRLAGIARESGLDPEALVTLAEATFAYIDELSAASVEGFAAEQSHRAGERDRLRASLLELLLSGAGDDIAITQAADRAGWQLPQTVVPVVLAPEQAEGLATRLGPAALVAPSADLIVALVPAPANEPHWRTLHAQLRDRPCAIGLPAPPTEIATSLRISSLALRLLNQAEPATTEEPIVVAERLVELMLMRDTALSSALAQRELAPLAQLRDGPRRRLTETLLAWLAYRGERQRVASALHVHPQTVAYRLTTLRRLFGEALTDPDRRFAIELALRAHALSPPAGRITSGELPP